MANATTNTAKAIHGQYPPGSTMRFMSRLNQDVVWQYGRTTAPPAVLASSSGRSLQWLR